LSSFGSGSAHGFDGNVFPVVAERSFSETGASLAGCDEFSGAFDQASGQRVGWFNDGFFERIPTVRIDKRMRGAGNARLRGRHGDGGKGIGAHGVTE
jgi:hypothetical protein